ncbi:hypothetical protein DLAC_05535 [Tieghemostelium lacteum]|uniref:Uncharacterized protein n=1 Tax=Tieghemostelium lacteum TaxID=361077 RepID=A0A151ZG43_TIELA|nr:hypothetical protein DLAC_05535 [Tieghemostelium lacteum]|eukprot:KYQ92938.1 hypothetical protein DLAC_05535 [Tieghemostelium lacteum]
MANTNIDLDEIDKLIEGRYTNINSFFKSEAFKESTKSWKEQRDSLRESLVEFWNDKDERLSFCSWWPGLFNDIKSAILMTSIEDLQQTLDKYNDYAPLVCPELSNIDSFVNESTQEQYLFKMISFSVDSKENDVAVFKGLAQMKIQFHNMDNIEEPNVVIQSLLVLRLLRTIANNNIFLNI